MVVHPNVIDLWCDFSRMDHYPVCSFLSDWAITADRPLGPKMASGVFLKDTRRVSASRVDPRFRKF